MKKYLNSLNKNCEQCHKDIHFGQFKVENTTTCERCHSFNDWKPVNFDHNKTKFSLDNAHKNVPCIKCHPSKTENGNKYFVYKLKDFKCATCHTK
jgi:nitrate/TMAO reductase-like tetraheme cytochrome c subunit